MVVLGSTANQKGMERMKRLFALLLACVLVLGMLPVTALATEEEIVAELMENAEEEPAESKEGAKATPGKIAAAVIAIVLVVALLGAKLSSIVLMLAAGCVSYLVWRAKQGGGGV